MKNKKAIAREQLVGMIIIIFSAVIIILLFGNVSLLFGKEVNKKACESSALARAAIIEKTGLLEKALSLPPLRCKTEHYCLSMGEKCLSNYDVVDVKDENSIKKEFANAMYDCWSQLGEGKKIFSRPFFQEPKICIICSIIDFSNDVSEKYDEINDFGIYLNTEIIPMQEVAYSNYITLGNISQIKTEEKYMVLFEQKLDTQFTEVVQADISVHPYNQEAIKSLSCSEFKIA